jgi:hypothetical protein
VSRGVAADRHRPVDSQADWEHELSFRRIYAALSSSLSEQELKEVLLTFFEHVGHAELGPGLAPGEFYERLFVAISLTSRGAEAWAVYVKRIHPEVPEGFDTIGKMGNSPQNPTPGPPPRSEHIHKKPPGIYESHSGDGD